MHSIDTEGMQMEHAVEEAAAALTFEPALNQAIRRIGELARECGDKAYEIAKLHDEIDGFKNKHAKPYRGCKLLPTECDGAPVVLEYEYDAACPGSWDEPSHPASAEVIRVWIGGHPFSYELFSDAQLEKWGDECLAAEGVGE